MMRRDSRFRLFNTIKLFSIFKLFCVIVLISAVEAGAPLAPHETMEFLRTDATNLREYSPDYTCGYFSRDLAMNASEYNITMGVVIFGSDPLFEVYDDTHAMNYVMVDDGVVLVEPQSDELYRLSEMDFKYHRFYPDVSTFSAEWGKDGIIDKTVARQASDVHAGFVPCVGRLFDVILGVLFVPSESEVK